MWKAVSLVLTMCTSRLLELCPVPQIAVIVMFGNVQDVASGTAAGAAQLLLL